MMAHNVGNWTFTCMLCSARNRLCVQHDYMVNEPYVQTLDCTCGAAPDGLAARIVGVISTHMGELGMLDDDHRVEWGSKERGETQDYRDDERSFVACEACVRDATTADWDDADDDTDVDDLHTEDDVDDVDDEDDEWAVYCDGCNREVEFGWSHPDRGGRIWPVEASDFIPRKSWPEPRFAEAWKAKGWAW